MRILYKAFLAFLLLGGAIALVNCNGVLPLPMSPLSVPATWKEATIADGIIFYTPPELERQPEQGIDSIVGRYRSSSLELTFDYGMYSGPWGNSQMPEYQEIWDVVDNKQVQVVTFHWLEADHQFKYIALAHFPNPGTRVNNTLTMVAWCKGPEQQQLAVRIFHTVRFPK